MNQINEQIENLRSAVRFLEQKQQEERDREREKTPIITKARLVRVHDYHSDRIMDPTVHVWRLEQDVVNFEEAKAAGHDPVNHTGGMNYLWNTLTQKFIMPIGGGRILVDMGFFSNPENERAESEKTMGHLEQCILYHGETGEIDVTEIIDYHKRRIDEVKSSRKS